MNSQRIGFPDINQLLILQRVTHLDMQSMSVMHDLQGRLKDMLEPMSDSFKAISSAFGGMSLRPTFFLSPKGENDALANLNYLDAVKLSIQVPEGMQGRMKPYTQALIKACEEQTTAINDVVIPFIHFLKDIYTNKSSIISVTKYANQAKSKAMTRDKLNRVMGSCFKQNSVEAYALFGEVYQSKADYIDVVGDVERLTDWFKKAKPEEVTKLLDNASEVMDKLTEQIGLGQLADASRSNIKYLADTAYECAREVEFYAVLLYRIQAVSNSLNVTHEKLLKMTGA